MVAGFIGQSNTLTGRVLGREGEGYVIDTPDGHLTSHGSPDLSGEVRILVRPENISPGRCRDAGFCRPQGLGVRRMSGVASPGFPNRLPV